MESNVTLRSNIYINATAKPNDEAFLQHITDYRILKSFNSSVYAYQNSANWMTQAQKAIVDMGQPGCSLEKGTKSWGVPVGGDHMVCRCEQYDCRQFPICSKYWNYEKVSRDDTVVSKPANEETSPLPLFEEIVQEPPAEHGESVAVIDTPAVADPVEVKLQPVEAEKEDPVEETFPAVVDTPVIEPQSNVNLSERVIVEQDVIISAAPTDRIWVNAGPGTGKTYTVIQRIKKLVEDDLIGTILVLCFSRNAVQVIRERLYEAMGHTANTLIDDERIIIRTFDSFASYMLDDELNTSWDYDKRIEEFIKALSVNPDVLKDTVDYLIVDEIQDTVGVRARMLLALLDHIKCGVLLLGDYCQAIFDWTIRNSNDMTFDSLSKDLERRSFKKYELAENRRQSKDLAKMGQQLRNVMLSEDEEAQETAINDFKKWAREKWRSYEIKALSQCLSGDADLVLCKTNGEAAHISQMLFETTTHTGHVMKQSTSHRSLAAWIAKVLYGNDGHFMAKADFMANAEEFEVDDADSKWVVLKSLDGHPHASVLHIPELLSALNKKDSLPEVCLNRPNDCVIVSTVHRAKGSEAEHVYWLDSPLLYEEDDAEDTIGDSLKAAYVAATRAKSDIHILEPDKRFFMRSVNDRRWIQLGWSKSKKPFCKGIAMLPGDVDPVTFVPPQSADEIQTILSCLEPGLPVKLFPNEEKRRFDIYFDGQYIGATSANFTADLFAGFDATNHNKNWPSEFPDVYIAAVTTETAPGRIDIDGKYIASGCWLGIELGGFPNIEWY